MSQSFKRKLMTCMSIFLTNYETMISYPSEYLKLNIYHIELNLLTVSKMNLYKGAG